MKAPCFVALTLLAGLSMGCGHPEAPLEGARIEGTWEGQIPQPLGAPTRYIVTLEAQDSVVSGTGSMYFGTSALSLKANGSAQPLDKAEAAIKLTLKAFPFDDLEFAGVLRGSSIRGVVNKSGFTNYPIEFRRK